MDLLSRLVLLHPHRELAPLGAEDRPGGADPVPDVQGAEALVALLAQLVDGGVQLDAARGVLQVGEGGLAVAPQGHEPPGHGRAVIAVGARLQGAEALAQAGHGVGSGVLEPEGLDAPGAPLLQLGQALAHELVELFLPGGFPVVAVFHAASIFRS